MTLVGTWVNLGTDNIKHYRSLSPSIQLGKSQTKEWSSSTWMWKKAPDFRSFQLCVRFWIQNAVHWMYCLNKHDGLTSIFDCLTKVGYHGQTKIIKLADACSNVTTCQKLIRNDLILIKTLLSSRHNAKRTIMTAATHMSIDIQETVL